MNSLKKVDFSGADLFVPMLECLHGQVIANCPFKKYWNLSIQERLKLLKNMDDIERDYLRRFHQDCVLNKYH